MIVRTANLEKEESFLDDEGKLVLEKLMKM